MSATGLVGRVAGGAVRAVRHPVSTASWAAGFARGMLLSALGRASEKDRSADYVAPVPPPAPPAWTAESPEPPVPEPAAPAESFATEPKASSRDSQHGGPGSDAEIDDWREEVGPDTEVTTPVGTTGVAPGTNPDTGETDLQQPGTEPLMDPATTSAVKSESDTLRRAAERDPE